MPHRGQPKRSKKRPIEAIPGIRKTKAKMPKNPHRAPQRRGGLNTPRG